MKSTDKIMKSPSYFQCHIFCCTNERPEQHKRGSCKRRGGEELRNYMKIRAKELEIKEIRVNSSGCLDRCELGPVIVVYPEGIWYHLETRADVDEVLERHIIGGEPVERLMLKKEQKTL